MYISPSFLKESLEDYGSLGWQVCLLWTLHLCQFTAFWFLLFLMRVRVVCSLSHIHLCKPVDYTPEEKSVLIILWFPSTWSEKGMAPHSSTLAWEILWMEEPGRLQSMESLRVRHSWATSLSLLTFMHWRRKWQPTPVFLPGESQGLGSLVGCRLWGRTESDTTEAT